MQCVAGPGSGLCPTLNSKPPLRGNIFGLLPCSVHSVVNIVTIKSNYLGDGCALSGEYKAVQLVPG